MSATTAPSSYFDKALPTLARASALPEAQAAAAYVGQWLAVLAQEPQRAGEFDAEIDDYAADLNRRGVLVGDQGAGFLLALFSRLNITSPLQSELVRQVDRRSTLRGMRHCRWRGTITAYEYDTLRNDRAAERAAMPSKFERPR